MTAVASLLPPTLDVGDLTTAPEPAPTTPMPVGGAGTGLSSERVAQMAKALGHPARVEIVKLLRDHSPLVVGDIVTASGLAQSTVSEHLRILRTAGIVSVRRDGSRSFYSLRSSVLRAFAAVLDRLGLPPI